MMMMMIEQVGQQKTEMSQNIKWLTSPPDNATIKLYYVVCLLCQVTILCCVVSCGLIWLADWCLSGAQDFLPDFQRASDWYRLRRKRPRYGPL